MSKVSLAYHKLDAFTKAYLEAALFSSNDESDESGGVPLDQNYTPWEHLSMTALESCKADCERFQQENAADIEAAASLGEYLNGRYTVAERAGHDFLLTRCGHGVGFWDRNLGEVGERLSKAARAFGNVDFYLGDDGKIYLA